MELKPSTMIITNEKFGNDRNPQHGSLFIRLGRLSIYACVLLFVPLGGKVACGSTDTDELDPTSLLAIDSEQQEQDLPDIQIPTYAEMAIQLGKPAANQLNSDLSQTIRATAANFAAEVGNKLPQTSPVPANASGKQLERQLSESRISPPAQSPENSKSNELRQIIEQVRSVKFETSHGELVHPELVEGVEPQQPARQSVDTSPAVTPQPTTSDSSAKTEPQLPALPTQPQPTGESTSDHTLQIVEGLLKDPNQISNPFELAEILFRSGRMTPAGLCYKQALKAMPTDDPNLGTERAWILFQIGNCLKDEDPNTARESYAELIRTHPDSPWAEIARVRHGLIEWYQQERPVELIRQLNRPKP
jgi:tetratricopeptide (TPR) repeat protein